MLVFISQIILALSLGGILLLVVRKIPVLATLPEQVQAVPKEKKALRERIQELDVAKTKEWFDIGNIKKAKANEDEVTKQEEFEVEGDYWQKVKGK